MKLFGLAIVGLFAVIVTLSLISFSCSRQAEHYSTADFQALRKIDAHIHDNADNSVFMDVAAENGFRLLSINVDYPDFPPLDDQARYADLHFHSRPELFAYAATFRMAGWDNPDWVKGTIEHLDSSFARGAVAVKFWKNIGMVVRDATDKLVMIDNQKFDPIIDHLVQKNVAVVFHCGEPRDCWLAVENMMSNDMKEYFSHHPHYHMALHPDMPSYEDQISARNTMLGKNPQVKFVGAHLGSLEWSVDELAKFFDKYPNAKVDLAARMDYLQIQSQKDFDKVYQFFMAFQDRILYGSDLIVNPSDDPKVCRDVIRGKWLSDWAYLATDTTMTLSNVNGPFKGLGLPKEVIDKIYFKNAEASFKGAWDGGTGK